MGAYSRWALILGWALIRINTVVCNFLVQSFCKYLHYNIFLFSYIFLSFFISLVDLLCLRGKSCLNNWSERIALTRSECSKRHLLYLPKAAKRINSFHKTISALLPINTFRSIGFAHIFLIAQPSLNAWVFHEPLCARTPLPLHYTLMYFWDSSPTGCPAVSVTYNSSKQWSTGERIVYFTVCFISWVPEVFSRVRRGASSADTSSAKGRRHERRRVPRAPRVTVTQSICFTSPHG